MTVFKYDSRSGFANAKYANPSRAILMHLKLQHTEGHWRTHSFIMSSENNLTYSDWELCRWWVAV